MEPRFRRNAGYRLPHFEARIWRRVRKHSTSSATPRNQFPCSSRLTRPAVGPAFLPAARAQRLFWREGRQSPTPSRRLRGAQPEWLSCSHIQLPNCLTSAVSCSVIRTPDIARRADQPFDQRRVGGYVEVVQDAPQVERVLDQLDHAGARPANPLVHQRFRNLGPRSRFVAAGCHHEDLQSRRRRPTFRPGRKRRRRAPRGSLSEQYLSSATPTKCWASIRFHVGCIRTICVMTSPRVSPGSFKTRDTATSWAKASSWLRCSRSVPE